jgi:two-component sensor histidine kinase
VIRRPQSSRREATPQRLVETVQHREVEPTKTSVGTRFAAEIRAPIVVDGQLWGAVIVDSPDPELLPTDISARVRDFADLVATAIANAAAREELTASRARIVTAADNARRRLERDLQDGAQQRLESLKLDVRMAEESIPPQLGDLRQQFSNIVAGLDGVSDDLHEFSRGIHPAVLCSGLSSALQTLARRSAVPVVLDVDVDGRLPESVEVAAYYIFSEALTNTTKHAQASEVHAAVHLEDAKLRLSFRDNGVERLDAIDQADESRAVTGICAAPSRAAAIAGEYSQSWNHRWSKDQDGNWSRQRTLKRKCDAQQCPAGSGAGNLIRPPSASTRSTKPTSPEPLLGFAPPTPLSLKERRSLASSRWTAACTSDACARLVVLVSASEKM